MEMTWWKPAQRQYQERLNHFPLGTVYISNQRLFYVIASSVGRIHKFKDQGIKLEFPYLLTFIITHWLCNPHTSILGDAGMQCLVYKEDTLPWRTQQWSHWTIYGLHLTSWVPCKTHNKPFLLLTLTQCLFPREYTWWYLTYLHSVPVKTVAYTNILESSNLSVF